MNNNAAPRGRHAAHAAHAPQAQPHQAQESGMTTQLPSDQAQPAGFMPAGQRYTRRQDSRVYNGVHSRSNVDVKELKKSKSGRGGKIALAIVATMAALVIGAGAALALWVNSLNESIHFEDEEAAAKLSDSLRPVAKEEAFYMLIIGSDSRSDDLEGSRSDVTMLARIDTENSTVHLISIPRDTMIDIPDQGTNKINAAYAFGGAAGAVETVSEFAGVPISHYAEVSFETLEEAVDKLGGVTVNVPNEFYSKDGEYFAAGEQVLSGSQALAFARERYGVAGGDFGRAQAQRIIVEAIINQILNSDPSQIPQIIKDLSSCVTTDYSVTDLILLGQSFVGKDLTFYSAMCPSYTNSIDGVSWVCTMFDEWQDMMRRVDAGMDPKDTTVEIPEPQASNMELGAAPNSPAPRDYQYLVESAGLTSYDVPGEEAVTEETASSETEPAAE